MADLGLKIRQELNRYLTGHLSLREFRDWFLPAAWNVDAVVDGHTASFVHAVELLLSEFDAGHWDESEVQQQLAGHLTGYSVTFGMPPGVVTDSSSRTEWAPIPVEPDRHPGSADIRFATAS